MSKNKIYTVKIDENIDQTLKNFEKKLRSNEIIIDTNVAHNNLIIVTELKDSKKVKNLLLETKGQ